MNLTNFEFFQRAGQQLRGVRNQTSPATVKDQFELAFTYVGNPQRNAIAERVIGTVKRECIWHHRLRNLAEAERIITAFVEKYNTRRRHSSLGNLTPAQAYRDSMKLQEVA